MGQQNTGTPFLVHFLQGLTLGLAYVAPIGVQNLFVLNTALSRSRFEAYRTALIVISFDVSLAFAGFFGAGLLLERFLWIRLAVLLGGSLFVIHMGIHLIRSPVGGLEAVETALPLRRVVLTACVVTWFNPQAVMDVTLLLGAFRASLPEEAAHLFLAGVVCASCTWFLGVTTLVAFCRSRFNDVALLWINRLCGLIVLGYGFRLAWSLVGQLC